MTEFRDEIAAVAFLQLVSKLVQDRNNKINNIFRFVSG